MTSREKLEEAPAMPEEEEEEEEEERWMWRWRWRWRYRWRWRWPHLVLVEAAQGGVEGVQGDAGVVWGMEKMSG